jgi:hypothetical protein
VPNDKLSAKEAALIAQARAQAGKQATTQVDTAAAVTRARSAAAFARAERAAPVAAIDPVARGATSSVASGAISSAASGAIGPIASGGAAPAGDPAQRVAALLAAGRAETERLKQRRRRLYVWVPVAFISAVGLWTLLWMWHRL